MGSNHSTIALVGVGNMGRNHARILSELGCLGAVCDYDATRAKEVGTRYDVPAYSKIEDLLDQKFDGCVICTPTTTHSSIASKVMQRGINTFVEKPLAFSHGECEELIRIAGENEVILTTGYIERFNPAVTDTRNLIASSKYGEPMMIEFHRENRLPIHVRDVGIIFELSVHDIDAAMFLFGKRPCTVFARAGKQKHTHEDFATIMLGFEDQKVAIIASNWLTPKKVRRFSAVCTEGIITGDFLTQEVKIDHAEATIIPRRQYQEPLRLELENFIGAIEGRTETLVSAVDGAQVTRVAEAAIQSSDTGETVSLEAPAS